MYYSEIYGVVRGALSDRLAECERAFVKSALRQIRTLYTLGALGGMSDAQLLELFVTCGGEDAEDAFSTLVDRHGPMVLGVCRRMLATTHDAEDAFQAAFLILARRASSIGRREKLAGWLHGVAVRTASEARRGAAQQRMRERRLMNVYECNGACKMSGTICCRFLTRS